MLKIWMTPLASVAMLEKLALLKIALCSAPVWRSASVWAASVPPLRVLGMGPRFQMIPACERTPQAGDQLETTSAARYCRGQLASGQGAGGVRCADARNRPHDVAALPVVGLSATRR